MTNQEIINLVAGSNNYTPVLNGISNIAVAYGIVQLVPGTKVKAIRVQKGSSTTQMDFFFESDTGLIDPFKMIKYLDGDTGYVVKVYNQVNSSTNHASQSTLSLTPIVWVDDDGVKIRYPDNANGNIGQAMTFTTAAITGNNYGLFCAYKGHNCSATNNGNGFAKRTLIGSSGGLLDLGADAAATNYDALMLGTSSTSTLYYHSHGTYLSLISNGTNATVDSGGINAAVALTARTTATETAWTLGNNNANTAPFSGDIFAFVLFNTAPTSANMATIKTGLQGACNLVLNAANNIVCEGDSLTAGTGSVNGMNWPNQLLSRRKDVWLTNVGIGGSTLYTGGGFATNSINTRVVHTDRNLVSGKNNILMLWIGTNDYANAARTMTQVLADLQTYAQARRTAGWNKIIVFTMIPRGTTTQNETDRTTLNTNIIADTTDWDYVADVGSDSRLQLVTAFTGTNQRDHNLWNSDDVHLVDDGYGIITAYAEETLANII